jgi:hypothetical protein
LAASGKCPVDLVQRGVAVYVAVQQMRLPARGESGLDQAFGARYFTTDDGGVQRESCRCGDGQRTPLVGQDTGPPADQQLISPAVPERQLAKCLSDRPGAVDNVVIGDRGNRLAERAREASPPGR